MSYCAVYLNRIHREKNLPEKPENPLVLEKFIPYDADFSFVDFVPSVLTYSSKAHEVEYHRFSHLVEAANNWIRKNSHWNIINCETVLLAYRHNVTSMVSRWEQLVNPVTPLWSPTNRGEFETVLKALRLWIQRKELMDDDNDDQQQDESIIYNEQKQKYIKLKYLDFIPQKLNSQNSDFETIDDLLIRVNLRLKQYDTFHWNIITLESLKIESNSEWTIDSEICLAEESTKHLTILRLYYGEYITDNKNGRMEIDFNNSINNNSDMMIMVGIEDFKPKLLSAGSFFRKPELESFATLVQRASTWLNDNQSSSLAAGHYFLNAQSINIKIKSLTKLKTKICTNTENGDYVQFLRIVYYKFLPRPQGPTVPAIQQPRPRSTEPKATITGTGNINQSFDVLRLCSKVFIATKLDHPLDSMQQRIYHWLHTESNQNICMLSAETIDIYAKDNDERVLEKKCSECFQGNRLGTLNTYTFKAIRLYYYLVETELFNQQNRSKCYNSISYSKTFPIQKQNQFNRDKNSSGHDIIQQHHQYHNRKKQQDREIRFDDNTVDNLYKTTNSNNNDNRRQIETSMGFMENLKKTQNEIRNRSKSCNCM